MAALFYLSKMKQIDQHHHGQAVVHHHGHQTLVVVISGPEATAGSMWILWNSMGISVPTRLETTMETISDIPTQPDSKVHRFS